MQQKQYAISSYAQHERDWLPFIQFRQMQFPQATVHRNWYKGRQQIHSLYFISCEFIAIQPNAFNNEAFKNLAHLSFKQQTHFEYRLDMFCGLPKLIQLSFHGFAMTNIDRDLLLPLRETIVDFYMEVFSSQLDFNEMFSSYKFLRLERLFLSECNKVRTLARENFTGLPILKELTVENGTLESICENAFDYIGVTLEVLNLSGNKLKTLPINLFNVIFEINCNYRLGVEIVLANNLWNCDCQLLEVLNLAPIYHSNWEHLTEVTGICLNATKIVRKCPNLQIINHKKFPLNMAQSYSMHPKVAIKLDAHHKHIFINSSIVRKIRVWIADHDSNLQFSSRNRNCPKFNWLHSYAKCIIISNGSIEFSAPKFIGPHLQFKTVCVNYIAANGFLAFWPLNCVTYHKFDPESIDFRGLRIAIILAACASLGILIGISSFYIFLQFNVNDNTELNMDGVINDLSTWKTEPTKFKNINIASEVRGRRHDEQNEAMAIDDTPKKDANGYMIFERNKTAEYEKVLDINVKNFKTDFTESLYKINSNIELSKM